MADKDASPGFSEFRYWLDLWDENVAQESKRNRIKQLVDGENLIMFFQKDGDVFGAPEESRLVFAKMKNPDDDMPKDWEKEANFIAVNLIKALTGDKVTTMFANKDLKKIKILDKDNVESLLMQEPAKKEKPVTTAITIKQSPHGKGMIKLRDKTK